MKKVRKNSSGEATDQVAGTSAEPVTARRPASISSSPRSRPRHQQHGANMVNVWNELDEPDNSPIPTVPGPPLDNPILEFYELCSVFVLDKHSTNKIFRAKRKDTMLERMRICVLKLESLRHPKMLQIIHTVEEGPLTLAFASERVRGSLQNILAWHAATPLAVGAHPPVMPHPAELGPPSIISRCQNNNSNKPNMERPPFSREYHFLDFELRLGLLQICEALAYLHNTISQIHHNICPQVIIVCERGTWKLFGLEFAENIRTDDATDMMAVSPWSVKVPKSCQPNLDYLAPEVQINGYCNALSDMFSLGLVICTIFNQGQPLIQANNNPALYMRQLEFLRDNVKAVMPRMPATLQEAVHRLCAREPYTRPNSELFPLIKYFKCQLEPAFRALQFLDVVSLKEEREKEDYYGTELVEAMPLIPKKLRCQIVWPALHLEIRSGMASEAVLKTIMWGVNKCDQAEFSTYLKELLLRMLGTTRCSESISRILNNLPLILPKIKKEEIENELLPLFFNSFDNKNIIVQVACLVALLNLVDYIDDSVMHTVVLGKLRVVVERHSGDANMIGLVLSFFEKVIVRIDRTNVAEEVIPMMLNIRVSNPEILNRIVHFYRFVVLDHRFGISVNVMATQVIPWLAPHTVNANLNTEQFSSLMGIMYDMLEQIDKNHRITVKEVKAQPTPERGRLLRFPMSSDNVVAPPFLIPNLRVDNRKTSSAEDVVRKNSVGGPTPASSYGNTFKSTGIGQWFFGSNNSNADNNFLRVNNVYTNRRLSDNALIGKKKLIAAVSSHSSPGGTPAIASTSSAGAVGLPTRRHSSIGPQERRRSALNLSPPTAGNRYRHVPGGSGSISGPSTSQGGGGSAPNTTSSVPFLLPSSLQSSLQSIRSRRPSTSIGNASAATSSAGASLLQQISTGMSQLLSSGT